MTENVENGSGIEQENSQNSENIQDNSDLDQQIPSEDTQPDPEGEETPKEKSENDELELPEPDISDEEVKKKKEMPEWMKKKLEREKVAADRQAEQALLLKEENDRLRAAQNGQPPQANQPGFDPNMPRRDQYGTEEQYFFAVADYRDNMRQQAAVFHHRQAAIQKAEHEYQSGLKNTVEEGKEKYKDFEARTDYILYGENFPPNRAMGEAIVASDHKSDILYFLGTHLKEAERIAALNPVLAVKEITKLEARFIARKKSNITKSPKIITPLGGNKGSATNSDPNKMGMDEFTNWYKDTYG